MPESKVRKDAAEKKSAKRGHQAGKGSQSKESRIAAGGRDWVPWVFIPVGLLGVIWLVVYYIAGASIPFMVSLGNWNFAIGMGLIAACFGIATLWK